MVECAFALSLVPSAPPPARQAIEAFNHVAAQAQDTSQGLVRDKLSEARALGNLGNALAAAGRLVEAMTCYRSCMPLMQELGLTTKVEERGR